MSEVERELLKVLEATRDQMVRIVEDCVAADPALQLKYSHEELVQLLQGFYLLIEEDLKGGATEVHDLFISTAIPALVSSGEDPIALSGIVSTVAAVYTSFLAGRLPEGLRLAGAARMARFFGGYNRDVMTAALGATDG